MRNCLSTTSDAPVVGLLLTDPRLERLLTLGREINDLLVKIKAATVYLANGGDAQDFEEVEIARNQLSRDLARDFSEAKELIPSVDEAVARLEEQSKALQNMRKMSIGLARIEGLSGTEKQKRFVEAAESTKAKISEIENLVDALDALAKDLSSSRRTPHVCPRCSSTNVSYRITPSELGYSLYRCDNCSNAWRITEFSLHVG